MPVFRLSVCSNVFKTNLSHPPSLHPSLSLYCSLSLPLSLPLSLSLSRPLSLSLSLPHPLTLPRDSEHLYILHMDGVVSIIISFLFLEHPGLGVAPHPSPIVKTTHPRPCHTNTLLQYLIKHCQFMRTDLERLSLPYCLDRQPQAITNIIMQEGN